MLALALLAAGCPEKKQAPDSPQGKGPAASTTERTSPPRTGVKIPLPQGWAALTTSEDSFQSGPTGRAVLRVDMRRGEGAKMPSAEQLGDSVRDQFSQFEVSLDQEEGDDKLALVRITLAPKLGDGGIGQHGPAMLGAKRIGDDLFLCATLPGATIEEVQLATEACRNIQVQAAPR